MELLEFDSNSNINITDFNPYYVIFIFIELENEPSLKSGQFCIIKLLELELVLMAERENEIVAGIEFEQFQHTGPLFRTWVHDHDQSMCFLMYFSLDLNSGIERIF